MVVLNTLIDGSMKGLWVPILIWIIDHRIIHCLELLRLHIRSRLQMRVAISLNSSRTPEGVLLHKRRVGSWLSCVIQCVHLSEVRLWVRVRNEWRISNRSRLIAAKPLCRKMWDWKRRCFHSANYTGSCISHSFLDKRFWIEFRTIISLVHEFSASIKGLDWAVIDAGQWCNFIHQGVMPIKYPHARVIIDHFVDIVELGLMRTLDIEVNIFPS